MSTLSQPGVYWGLISIGVILFLQAERLGAMLSWAKNSLNASGAASHVNDRAETIAQSPANREPPATPGRINIGIAAPPEYDTGEPLPDGRERRHVLIVVRNIGQVPVRNIEVHWQQMFRGKAAKLDVMPLLREAFSLKVGDDRFIPLAYRDETVDREFREEGGDIFLFSSFGDRRFAYGGDLRISASSPDIEPYHADVRVKIHFTGSLTAGPCDD